MFTTIISVEDAHKNLANPNWVFVDCRFGLKDTGAGKVAYVDGHIPGAVYAHLDDDLSGPAVTDSGRHPLPTPAALCNLFGRFGIDDTKQVVVYDNMAGAYAGRLWWMLRYMGHQAVANLDGGWDAWLAADLPTERGEQTHPATVFEGEPNLDMLVLLADVEAQPLLIDSRAAGRYRGEFEPLDPRAGHIPGAKNRHFTLNWDAEKKMLSAETLRQQFSELLGDVAAQDATFYCGSGVTACTNLLAMTHAGLPTAKLYVGSWSEWSSDPERVAETD